MSEENIKRMFEVIGAIIGDRENVKVELVEVKKVEELEEVS